MATAKRSAVRTRRPAVPPTEPATPNAPAPADKNDFAVGDHISHPTFGNGIVRGIDQNKLKIEFSENGTKEIIAGYVKRRSS
jgi:hypothetical protein